MPSRNTVKQYVEGGYYHVYNRGVEKRKLYLDNQDYGVFMNLLKRYLSGETAKDKYGREYADLSESVKLLAFCLMPNHFHLFIRQDQLSGMTELMRRLMTSYAGYFNYRYKRVGNLFQDHYKAAYISDEQQFAYLSAYIHLNPIRLTKGRPLEEYTFSSYPYYLGLRQAKWLHPEPILSLHNTQEEYREFIEGYQKRRMEHRQLEAMFP